MLILYGENIVLSRKRLNEKIADFQGEVTRLAGEQVDLTQLKQATESSSLFDLKRLIIIEGIFSCRPSKRKEEVLTYLKENPPQNLIIWEGKKIDGRTLAPFPGAKVEKFDLTPLIFKLLDALAPNNQRSCLTLLHQCLAQDSPEMVFYMLARQIGLLIMAKDLGKKGLRKMAGWQQNKLLHQTAKFDLPRLLWFHQQLLKTDWQQKTGRAPLPLSAELDLLIASL